jgi:hypothetical protein
MKTSTLDNNKLKDLGRTGTHGTIYKVKKDPKIEQNNYIKNKNITEFGFINGSSYKGCWQNNQKHGFGIEITSNGNKYEGEYIHNKRHGCGTLWIKRNNKYMKQYSGNWANDKMEGEGIFTYEDGSIYKGNWFNNHRHYNGRMEFNNGDIYIGEWYNDVRSGSGTLLLNNGNIYEGHWLNNMKEGPGKFFYASTNKVYEGNYIYY